MRNRSWCDGAQALAFESDQSFISTGSVFMCQLCEVECSSEQMLEAHVNGKSHRKRREQKAYGGTAQKFRCDLCKIETTDQRGLEDHKRGKKHLKKMVDTGGY